MDLQSVRLICGRIALTSEIKTDRFLTKFDFVYSSNSITLPISTVLHWNAQSCFALKAFERPILDFSLLDLSLLNFNLLNFTLHHSLV